MGIQRLTTTKVTLTNQSGVTSGSQDAGVWVGNLEELLVVLDVTAISGSGASLTVFIDAGIDGNETQDATTWVQIASFTAVTAQGLSQKTLHGAQGSAFGDRVRIRWTLAGTTPSATFKVVGLGK